MTSCNELLEDLEHAQMAECAYRRGSCDARWQPVSPASIGIAPELFSFGDFHAELFYDAQRNRYTLAFRGTDGKGDWEDNGQNGIGLLSAQYYAASRLAIEVERRLEQKNPIIELTYTGHSLGGGLATMAAVTTDRSATVFNTAALHSGSAHWAGVSLDNAGYLVHRLHVSGEPVSSLQRLTGAMNFILEKLIGQDIEFFAGDAPGHDSELPQPSQTWMLAERERLILLGFADKKRLDKLILHSMNAVTESMQSVVDINCPTAP